jgi:hypothetical protein
MEGRGGNDEAEKGGRKVRSKKINDKMENKFVERNPAFKHPVASLCTTQSINSATNCYSFFLSLSLSTQHVSALNGHLQVSYYVKTATLH